MIRWAICFLFLVNLSAASGAVPPSTISEKEFQTYQELAQTKLDAAQTSASKDMQSLQTRLDNQDKRLDDQQSRISDLGLYIALFETFITLAVAALVLIGYFSVRNLAREEARTESKKWFDKEAQSLKLKISGFEGELAAQKENLERQADQHSAAMQAGADEFANRTALANKQIPILQEQLSRPTAEHQQTIEPTLESKALDEIANQLRGKPESEYSFDDWNNRAFAAIQSKKLEDAIYFWQRATEIKNANPTDFARALINKGAALGKLERTKDEVAVCDDLLARFGDAAEPALRELVARALVNKGAALVRLERGEAAIAVYDDILARFGDATEPALRELVAEANNSKGFTLLIHAKEQWQDTPLQTSNLAAAADCFAAALDKTDTPDLHAAILGNQAYAAALSGDPMDRVHDRLQQALRLGCESLYQGTLKDLEISPVPNDADFRLLLEAVWSEVKSDCATGKKT